MRDKLSRATTTRHHVLRVAAAEMRSRGPTSVGVVDVMKRAGLTHGGFYGHFSSKDALVAAALEQMFAQGAAKFRRITAGKPPGVALGDYIDLYLSEIHRDRPEIGCPIAALSPELARQGLEVRRVFEHGLTLLLDLLEPLLPAENRRVLAYSMIAEMAGALALSRAVQDRTTSLGILAAARATVRARADLPEHAKLDPIR